MALQPRLTKTYSERGSAKVYAELISQGGQGGRNLRNTRKAVKSRGLGKVRGYIPSKSASRKKPQRDADINRDVGRADRSLRE